MKDNTMNEYSFTFENTRACFDLFDRMHFAYKNCIKLCFKEFPVHSKSKNS